MKWFLTTLLVGLIFPTTTLAASGAVTSMLPQNVQAIYIHSQATPATLKLNAKGPKVKIMQRKLYQLGYLNKADVDGYFGQRTKQAVLAFQLWENLGADGVVGPKTWKRVATAKRPSRPEKNGIVVEKKRGLLFLQKNGRTVRIIHVSLGKPGYSTPTGSYSVYRKEKDAISEQYDNAPMPWAVYFLRGYAIHESSDVPTYPASHGCVRVPIGEGPTIWRFAPYGTNVKVV